MGQKVHPTGFRIGVIGDWRSKWYTRRQYTQFIQEDLGIHRILDSKNPEASISRVDIERGAAEVTVTAYTARPGIVIGRGGQKVDELKRALEGLVGKRVRLNIQEIREPELDATLVARNVAGQIEHHVAYRRAMKRTISRTMQAGAKGIKIICSGRLGGGEIARRETMHEGRVPLHTLRADIDYGVAEARTMLGRIGVKVWIYKGDILPVQPEELEREVIVSPPAAAQDEKTKENAAQQQVEIGDNVTTEANEVSEST